MCHFLLGVFSFFIFYLRLGQISQLGDTFYIFFNFCFDICWSYEERESRKERKEEDGGEARGEREGRWRFGGEDIGKDRGEDRGGDRRDRREDRGYRRRFKVTEEACKEDERCEEESECHSAAKRARVCATFTDSQEYAIVEFVKEHPELYDKEHRWFHDRHRGLSVQKSLQN